MGQGFRKTALILEDQPLIALDIEDALQSAGFEVANIVSSSAAAIVWLKQHQPTIAVIDIEVTDGACVEVAKTLNAAHIPFIVHTGSLPDDNLHDPIFRKGHWIIKPSAPADLVAAVERSLGL